MLILFALIACDSDDQIHFAETSVNENLMLHKNASFLEENVEINSIINSLNYQQASNKSSVPLRNSDLIIYI